MSIRTLVIGTGALGRHHARILSELPESELVGVVDVNSQSAKTVAQSCKCRWSTDILDFLADADAVVVAVPTAHHFSTASQSLDRGIATFVEKPITPTVEDAERLVAIAEARGTVLQVGHIERFNPAFDAIRTANLVPHYIRAQRVSPFPFRSMDIGVVHDLMIHDLDLVLSLEESDLVGVEATGLKATGSHEDVVAARLTFESGCVAELFTSRIHPKATRTMEVWGDNGWVHADFAERTGTICQPTPALRLGPSLADRAAQPGAEVATLRDEFYPRFIGRRSHTDTGPDSLTRELQNFLSAAAGDVLPLVDGRQGLDALKAAEDVLEQVRLAPDWDWSTPSIPNIRRAA